MNRAQSWSTDPDGGETIKVVLRFVSGTSDKVYQINLLHNSEANSPLSGWGVYFAYGRRGSPLKGGPKITYTTHAAAANVFFTVLSEKLNKGYKTVSATVTGRETTALQRLQLIIDIPINGGPNSRAAATADAFESQYQSPQRAAPEPFGRMSQADIDRLNKLARDRAVLVDAAERSEARKALAARQEQLAMIARRRKAAPAPEPELFAKVRRRIVLED